ncbi:MAG: PP2C family protein-serine/threonine phosphatase [Anaerolineae bacterium]
MKVFGRWLRGFLDGEADGQLSVAVTDEIAEGRDGEELDSTHESAGDLGVAETGNGDSPESREVTSASAHFPGAFVAGWKTDAGRVRGHNEDALLVFVSHQDASQAAPPFGLFMIADGMGGHSHGEVASSLALRVAASQLISQIYLPLLAGTERGANQPALTDVVRDAVTRANRAVNESYPGSGSTLTYGMVLGDRLFVGHVGDSRAYLLRRGDEPRRLTKDHSFVNRLIEMGQLTEQEALAHPQRNVLYRAIGQPEHLEVDISTCALQSGDCLFLCSDGLWNMLEEPEMWAMIEAYREPQSTCEQLVEAANAAGGNDNITVVLAEVRL